MLKTWLLSLISKISFKILPAKASTFLDSCHFEEPNICGMIQGDGGNAKWARVQTVEAGPTTDYTTLGQCQGIWTPINTKAGFNPTTFLNLFLEVHNWRMKLLASENLGFHLCAIVQGSPAHCEISLVQNPYKVTLNIIWLAASKIT